MYVYLDNALIAKFVDMHMICMRITLHMLSSSGLFIIAIKPKPKDRLHAAAILLSYTEKEPYQSYRTQLTLDMSEFNVSARS